jgi:predicted  nucleic acid-binding Zn-ribbon protein
MSRAFKLYRLQQVDSQLDTAQARLAEIERILNEDEAMRTATQTLAHAQAALHAAHSALRTAEEEVAAQQRHIQQNQASLYGGKVTNPKELQDLQKEAEALGRRLSELEDAQLDKMSVHEQKQAALKEAEEELEALKAQQAVEQRALHSEQSQLEEELARLQEEHSTALNGVEAAELETYQGLRRSKGGIAVAKIEDGACAACGAELSAAIVQAARSADGLSRCDNCKRLLYAG